ncbi:MAG: DUF4091 domain-containing protein [Thermoproteales archaeon]|nr:DUF4091 domain-containing protein [Thermoproteales archaeon]
MKKFIVWFPEEGTRIFRESKPPKEILKSIELDAIRNEYEGIIFGIHSLNKDIECRLEITELVKDKNEKISKNNINVSFIGYIPISKNTPNTPEEELEINAPTHIPDPILNIKSMEIKQGNSQACWYSIYIPKDIEPGKYEGKIYVICDNEKEELNVFLNVYPITLPSKKHLFITNWFDVNRISKYYDVDLWSEDFWNIFRKWISFMNKYGQNVFLVPLSTIKIYKEDRGYKFDFSIFDRYITILFDEGAERIELSHLAHFKEWGHRELLFRDFNVVLKNGKEIKVNGDNIIPYLLPAIEKHLDEKKWLDKTLIHIADEPIEDNFDVWKETSEKIHRYAPKLRRIEAIETIGFENILEVWVPTLQHYNDWMESYDKAREKGYEIWFYTCLNPKGRYPNRFLDYPLIKTRILHWINYAFKLKGYLHWGFDKWPDDPFGEPVSRLPPGDSHISYPGKYGPLPSLRLEAMRDGIEDYELFIILENEIRKIKKVLGFSNEDPPYEFRAMELCREVVQSIINYPRKMRDLLEIRKKVIKEIMEVRKRPYILVFTEPYEYMNLVEGPVTVIVKGICENGSSIEVNGKKIHVRNNRFSTAVYLSKENNIVSIRIEKDGKTKVIKRKFRITL